MVQKKQSTKRKYVIFTETQVLRLKIEYAQNKYPKREKLEQLAADMGRLAKSIQYWFQNRRKKEREFGVIDAVLPKDYLLAAVTRAVIAEKETLQRPALVLSTNRVTFFCPVQQTVSNVVKCEKGAKMSVSS